MAVVLSVMALLAAPTAARAMGGLRGEGYVGWRGGGSWAADRTGDVGATGAATDESSNLFGSTGDSSAGTGDFMDAYIAKSQSSTGVWMKSSGAKAAPAQQQPSVPDWMSSGGAPSDPFQRLRVDAPPVRPSGGDESNFFGRLHEDADMMRAPRSNPWMTPNAADASPMASSPMASSPMDGFSAGAAPMQAPMQAPVQAPTQFKVDDATPMSLSNSAAQSEVQNEDQSGSQGGGQSGGAVVDVNLDSELQLKRRA